MNTTWCGTGGLSQAGKPSVSPQDADKPLNPDDTVQASEEVGAEGEEALPARGLPFPIQPTHKEIQEDELTHLPPRSKCGHCVMVRVTSLPHFRSEAEKRGHVVPTVSIYYFFMGPSAQDEAEGVFPMLAVKSHESQRRSHMLWNGKGLWISQHDDLLQISIG